METSYIQQAIEKAIEGDWKPDRPYLSNNAPDIQVREVLAMMLPQEILLDRFFWQSLGKSLGFDEDKLAYYSLVEIDGEITNEKISLWKSHFHRFIDHLISGKDAESFFKDLLSNK